MRNFIFLFGIFWIFTSAPALAERNPILQHVPNAQKVGAGRLNYLLWDVYDATLYAPGKIYNASEPYALRLDYLLELKGADIAKRSAQEIRNQGFADEAKIQKWQKSMEEIFPNVKKGNSLTGIRDENGHTLFYFNTVFVGAIKDKEFTKHFFAIWLAENTPKPALRRTLLGSNL